MTPLYRRYDTALSPLYHRFVTMCSAHLAVHLPLVFMIDTGTTCTRPLLTNHGTAVGLYWGCTGAVLGLYMGYLGGYVELCKGCARRVDVSVVIFYIIRYHFTVYYLVGTDHGVLRYAIVSAKFITILIEIHCRELFKFSVMFPLV